MKVLELLLVLMETGRAESQEEKAYFSQSQTDAVKQIHGFLVEHYSEHYTIDWLSEQFGISSTIMKRCFKEMYGDSMYAYMKRYRLQVAESLLRKSKLTVGEIAAQIGYMNPNKFTSAFTDEYGMSPSVFRRKCLNG